MNRIKNVKPTNRNYFQGYYNPINPEKYIGKLDEIIYRSSYEYRFCVYCDKTDRVIKWSSEPAAIKYYNPMDKKIHEYYVDFYVKLKGPEDKDQDILVEVKPSRQLSKPVYEKKYMKAKSLKNYNKSCEMYIQNMSKWKAAKQFADERDMKFMIITEKNLGL